MQDILEEPTKTLFKENFLLNLYKGKNPHGKAWSVVLRSIRHESCTSNRWKEEANEVKLNNLTSTSISDVVLNVTLTRTESLFDSSIKLPVIPHLKADDIKIIIIPLFLQVLREDWQHGTVIKNRFELDLFVICCK